jgi:hypothetical protein
MSETCNWIEDDDGVWGTECGNFFDLGDGTPHENGMHWCPYCGLSLQETKGSSFSNVGLGGTIWGYGEDNDGWYVGPPGEQIGYAISESDAKRIAACVNACIGIPTDVLNINGVSPNP